MVHLSTQKVVEYQQISRTREQKKELGKLIQKLGTSSIAQDVKNNYCIFTSNKLQRYFKFLTVHYAALY
jgi:ribosomal protein L17